MKKFFSVILFGFAAVFNLSAVPTSAEQLRSELESAIKAKDTNAIATLFNLQGVSTDMKSQVFMMATAMVYDGVASVKLSPLPADIELTNQLNGVRYSPNVRVIGVIDIVGIKTGNGTQLPYGELAGKFYLPGTIKETIDTKAPKEKGLHIWISSTSGNQAGIIFNGSYVYLKAGKEITKTVIFTNQMSSAFYGDSIKSCQFKSSSSEGSAHLWITEDGINVFDSGTLENTNSISYEKK